jgi:hypothetical protein
LVSCITSPKERFQPLITSTATSVAFFTNTKLCCCTNSLSINHVDAPKSRSVWVHIVMDLSPLIVMGNKRQGVSFENKVGLF